MTFFRVALSILMLLEIFISVLIFYDADVRVKSYIDQNIQIFNNNKDLVDGVIIRDAITKNQAIRANHILENLEALKGPLTENDLGKIEKFNEVFYHIYENFDNSLVDIIRLYTNNGFLISRYIRGKLDNDSILLNYKQQKYEEGKIHFVDDLLDYAFLVTLNIDDSVKIGAPIEIGVTMSSYIRAFKEMTKSRNMIYIFKNEIDTSVNIPSYNFRDLGQFRTFVDPLDALSVESMEYIARAIVENNNKPLYEKINFINIENSRDIAYYIPIKAIDGRILGYFIKLDDNSYISEIKIFLILFWAFVTFVLFMFILLLYILDRRQKALAITQNAMISNSQIFDNSLSIVRFDDKFKITGITDSAIELFKVERNDLIGKSIKELINLSKDYKRLRESFFKNFKKIKDNRMYNAGVFPFSTSDNKEIFLFVRTGIIKDIMGRNSYMTMLINLTREYEAINALRIVEENSDNLNKILNAYVNVSGSKVVVFNKQLKIEYTNINEGENNDVNLNIISHDLPCGEDCKCYDDGHNEKCNVLKVFNKKQPIIYENIDDEKSSYQNISFIPIFDTANSNNVRFVVYECRDITSYIKNQRELININQRERKLVVELQAVIQEKEESNRRVIEANKAKNTFLANMSHEIRTPMNGIMGFLSLLKTCKLDETGKEYLDIINSASESLLSVINNILDFSKIESGKMDLELIPANIVENVENIISMYIAKAEEKNIKLIVYLDVDIPTKVNIDIVKFKQVVSNLLSNSIKFTLEGGTISIKLTKLYKEGKNVRIYFEIKDTGVGISEEAIKNIFKPFAQADVSTTRRFGGTGLGLSISSGIINLMGSKLNVESEEGKGTSFYFDVVLEEIEPPLEKFQFNRSVIFEEKLEEGEILEKYLNLFGYEVKYIKGDSFYVPNENYRCLFLDAGNDFDLFNKRWKNINIENRHNEFKVIVFVSSAIKNEVDRLDGIDISIIKPAMPYRLLDLYKRIRNEAFVPVSNIFSNKFNGKVLVAEDNIVNQKLIEILLSTIGLNVSLASDGEEAVEMLRKNEYDIIFMDIHMPHKDGIEATKDIIAMGIKTPIVALTANIVKEDIDIFFQVGMVDYISKPINNDKLLGVLQKYLG